MKVHGVDVDPQSRCRHWRCEFDVVAIQFPCCGEFYACHACHEETADHEAERWPSAFHDELAILCGRCQTRISIRDYLSANDACPNCGGAFNPGCRLHRDLYFA